MSLLAENITDNFWKLYPNYKLPKVYKKLYDSDKSKGKSDSSNVMWCIIMLYDNSDLNPYRNVAIEEKQSLISEEIYNIDWDKYEDVMNFYENTTLSSFQRSLHNFTKKLEEREKYLMDTPYSTDTAKDLDIIFTSTDKIFNTIEKLKKYVEDEANTGQVKGNRKETAAELGLV